MLAAGRLAARGRWTYAIKPPRDLEFWGFDIAEHNAECVNSALRPEFDERVKLSHGDLRDIDLVTMGALGAVIILDVLHYLSHVDQDRMLDHVRAALVLGGLLIVSVSDAAGRWCFTLSKFVDHYVFLTRGRRYSPLCFRSVESWLRAVVRRGFKVQIIPMSQGTLFANSMLVARVM
jgi:SAM-dependent methyltransferase